MVEAVVGSVVSGVVGKALGGGKSKAQPQQQYQTLPGTEFQPYTYKSSLGSVTGAPEGDYGYTTDVALSPELQALQQQGFGEAGNLYGMLPALYSRPEAVYDQTYDPLQAQQDYYQMGLEQLQPEFQKQAVQAQERMFGSGRLGLKLAGEGLGAGTSQAVSPDAYGLGLAQSRALTDLYAQSRDKARAEEQARLEAESGIFSTQQQAEADYLNRILKGGTTMFGLGSTIADMESALRKEALEQEVARSNALKQGTQAVNVAYKETPQSLLAGQLAPKIGEAAAGLFSGGGTGGSWFDPSGAGAASGYGMGSIGYGAGYGINPMGQQASMLAEQW